MLYSVELKLSLSGGLTGQITGHHALSLFLRIMEGANASISEELHEDGQIKPFTTALVTERGSIASRFAEKPFASLRLTFMREEIFSAFLDAVWRLPPDANLVLGGSQITCRGIVTVPGQSQWAGFTSFEEILDTASAERKIALSFLSPTTFRSRGRRNVIFPEPWLVFQSLLNRWNAFAPVNSKLKLDENAVTAVRISSYRLTTGMLDFGDYQELGFQGHVNYQVYDSLSEDIVKAINALGEFAFYAGVGAKTTMGMGQARRVDYARPLSHRARSHPQEGRRPASGN